ncbi:hypothetical protein AVEN_271850-1 [Araneus ventricosus]|uniref:Uncharacterized protein n=1 Tax=Araneus ventricosus TaxID=182803 RepID=A0A4Y2UY63_ARAVE|nr:hypothetical protein AVEN_271850-1 [Araneus ventricosus]
MRSSEGLRDHLRERKVSRLQKILVRTKWDKDFATDRCFQEEKSWACKMTDLIKNIFPKVSSLKKCKQATTNNSYYIKRIPVTIIANLRLQKGIVQSIRMRERYLPDILKALALGDDIFSGEEG